MEVRLMCKKVVFFGWLSVCLVGNLCKPVSVFALCHPQCLEYVQTQTDIGGPYGNAHGAWKNAPGHKGWRKVLKDGNEVPSPGDVLYWNIGSDGHVAMIRNVNVNEGTVYVDDRNWDENCGFRSGVEISLDDANVVGWLTNKSSSLVSYRVVPDPSENLPISIAWYPGNVPCDKASVWAYNETCSAANSHPSICQTAYDELLNIDYDKYHGDDWHTIFFGSISDFQDLCY